MTTCNAFGILRGKTHLKLCNLKCFFLNTHEFKILPFKNYEWITSSEGVEENIEKLFIS